MEADVVEPTGAKIYFSYFYGKIGSASCCIALRARPDRRAAKAIGLLLPPEKSYLFDTSSGLRIKEFIGNCHAEFTRPR